MLSLNASATRALEGLATQVLVVGFIRARAVVHTQVLVAAPTPVQAAVPTQDQVGLAIPVPAVRLMTNGTAPLHTANDTIGNSLNNLPLTDDQTGE